MKKLQYSAEKDLNKEPLLSYVREVGKQFCSKKNYLSSFGYRYNLLKTIEENRFESEATEEILARYNVSQKSDEELDALTEKLDALNKELFALIEKKRNEYYQKHPPFESLYQDDKIQDVINHFGLNPDKFYYLVLFIADYVNSGYKKPYDVTPPIDQVLELSNRIKEQQPGARLVFNKGKGQDYKVENPISIKHIAKAIDCYINQLDPDSDDYKELYAQLLRIEVKELRLNLVDPVTNEKSSKETVISSYDFKTQKLDDGYKHYAFCFLLHWFMDKHNKVNREFQLNCNSRYSVDKWLFASRLIYALGWVKDNEGNYDTRYWSPTITDKKGKSKRNDFLKRNLSKYNKEKLDGLKIQNKVY